MFFCANKKEPGKIGEGRDAGQPASGFTLMEILVALSVFAVLISIVLGSLSFLLSKSDSMREDIALYEEARICLDRISADLRSVYVSVAPGYTIPDIDDDPDPYRFFCEEARLEFTAFSHLPMGGGVPARAGGIVYYLRKAGEEGQVLMRRDEALRTGDSSDRFGGRDEEETDPVLCRDIKSFSVVCFDKEGKEYDSWDSDSGDFSYATPVAVRIRIELEGVNGSLLFETMVALPVHREKTANAL